jgi:hypothetical protein
VTDDEDRALADQLLCGGNCLLGIAEVIRSDEL